MLNEALQLPESLLPFINGNQLAIDCGISSSKIVFSVQLENHEQVFRSLGLLNEELKTVLLEIQETFGQKVFEKIFVVGFKNLWAKTVVKSVFDADANVVEEISALSNGVQLISDNFQLSEIEIKNEESLSLYDKYKIDMNNNPMFQKVIQAMRISTPNETKSGEGIIHFPSIIVLGGSALKFYLLNSDGSAKLIAYSMFARETLKGLFKCLVDSNNFKENILLASIGDREKIDTQVYEVLSENLNTPYGQFPPDLPIFSFGKCADYNKGKEDVNPNDLLESLSFLFIIETNNQVNTLCKAFKTKYVYFCGDIFNYPLFSKILQLGEILLPRLIETKILNVDYILALGTLKK